MHMDAHCIKFTFTPDEDFLCPDLDKVVPGHVGFADLKVTKPKMKPRPARLQASHARVMRTGTRAEQAQFAFAAVIWDNESDEASLEGYIMDAVVLGRSLQEHAPKADRIMLATRSALMSALLAGEGGGTCRGGRAARVAS